MKSFGKSVAKFEKRIDIFDTKRSKSLLNVPAIFVDNEKETLTISVASSVSDLDEMVTDMETVSMIVRNVEAMDMREMVEIELPKVEEVKEAEVAVVKKPHGVMHSIQEKLHLLHHKKEAEHHKTSDHKPSDHKTKEIFHDIKENVSGKIHLIAEKMHHFHLPHHHQEVPHDGLVATAMQAILMDKFNIAEASTAVHVNRETTQKRKSSSSSLQSLKEKFNLIQRPRRSLDMPSETTSLKSILEASPAKPSVFDDNSSFLELKIHGETSPVDSESSDAVKSTKPITSSQLAKAAESPETDESFKASESPKPVTSTLVGSSNSTSLTHKPLDKVTTFADTNKSPLHESLLSLTRKELSTSPGVKGHARTDSAMGMKFSASPAKNVSSSLGKDQILTGIHRRSSDSDLSITPKGGELGDGRG
jgi:hypothetical protein